MTDALARVMFGVTVLLLVPTLAFLYLSSRPSAGGNRVVAQFEDAFPLVEGMNVRVDGAIAGSVGPIDVNRQGMAEVTLLLEKGVEPARADATAAIRQQDTTGDSYVAYEPGRAKQSLPEHDGRPTIRCSAQDRSDTCPHTLVAPRFDDLLNAFGAPERTGIQLTLTELSRALDERGSDLNRSALQLRPALVAANNALTDVNRQNRALRSFIADAEAVTGQAASRRASLQRTIDGLAGTLSATAAEARSLDAGLERLPATLGRARTTLAALTRAGVAGRPLAEDLGDAAPLLSTAVGRAPAFLTGLRSFLERTRPTLGLTHKVLVDATPAIEAEPKRLVTGPFDLAPAISNLLRGVLGEDQTIEALFSENFGLGAAAQEPGNQPSYPADWTDRRFLRSSAILNCAMFGVPVKAGCLLDLLAASRAGDRSRASRRRDTTRARSAKPAPRPPVRAAQPRRAPVPSAPPASTPSTTPAPAPARPAPTTPAPTVRDLMDFLLK